MGQRHQLFVIAKVKGRYRTLCAIHHQWLYGQTALKRCLGTLKIFQDPLNRLPIQQELIAAQRQDDSVWISPNGCHYYDTDSSVPFPFIAACLVAGASYAPDGYFHVVSIEPFHMPFNGGDNNNGITIFDITNPSHVSYCFVDYQGMESEREVPLMTPLSARTYLEAYYELSDPKHSDLLMPLVQSFEGWDLIPASVLEDTWPGEGWMEEGDSTQDEDGEELDVELEKLDLGPKNTVETLREKAMDAFLQSLLDQSEEDPSLTSEAALLTDFLPQLKKKLYDQATNLDWSSYQIDLLCQALKNEVEVDLAPFAKLSTDKLAFIVSKLHENGKIRSLSLSNCLEISEKDLHTILETILGSDSTLQVLCLLEMPQVHVQSLGVYLTKCEVHHSELLRMAWKVYRENYDCRGSSLGYDRVPQLEFPRANIVSQIFWIGLGYQDYLKQHQRVKDGRIAWEKFSLSSIKSQYLYVAETLENRVYDLGLPIPPTKLAQCVLRLVQWLGSTDTGGSSNLAKGIACSIATTKARLDGTGNSVSALDPCIYLANDHRHSRSKEQAQLSLTVGEWALILVSEAFDAYDQEFLDDVNDKCNFGGEPNAPSVQNEEPESNATESSTQIENAEVAPAPQSNTKAQAKDKVEFRPRKGANYALVKRVADSGLSQYIVADVPDYLKEALGDTPECKDLIELWTTRFSGIGNSEFFGDNTNKILPKICPKNIEAGGNEAETNKAADKAAGDRAATNE